MSTPSKAFRKTFEISKAILNWYPGHMNFSFKHMQAKMRAVDCVIEVHDSRIPFSGRNPLFLNNLIGTKPHILVLNKVDLIDPKNAMQIENKHKENNLSSVVFTNCLNQNCKGLKNVVSLVGDLVKEIHSTFAIGTSKHKVMVVGIPNVGKSSLINALRNICLHRGKATIVGANPGVTKNVQNDIKIYSDPPIYLIDTPGIILPRFLDTESGMKLALCSCIKDEVVGITTIADFLLYKMNKVNNFKYVEQFQLKEPTDDIVPLLIKIALINNKTKKIKNIVKNSLEVVPDIFVAAHLFVNHFRKGEYGDLCLDIDNF